MRYAHKPFVKLEVMILHFFLLNYRVNTPTSYLAYLNTQLSSNACIFYIFQYKIDTNKFTCKLYPHS